MQPESFEPLINAVPAIAKGVAAVGAAIPFTAITKRMLGPAADEVAEMLRDQVRLYRYQNALKSLKKYERLSRPGFRPQPVPPKLLFPLLEGASFEEDDDVQDMWAALLATAASPSAGAKARPAFIGILTEMSSEEALLLNWIFDHPVKGSVPVTLGSLCERFIAETARTISPQTFRSGVEELTAKQLVYLSPLATRVHNSFIGDVAAITTPMRDPYSLTHRGVEFITACRPPLSRHDSA